MSVEGPISPQPQGEPFSTRSSTEAGYTFQLSSFLFGSKKLPPAQLPAQSATQSSLVVTAPGAPQMPYSQKSPQEAASTKVLQHLLSKDKDFSKFNTIADSLKKNEGWESAVESQVKNMSDNDLLTLIKIPEIDLRGCDRQVVKLILEQAKLVAETRTTISSEDTQKLDQKIQNLGTRVETVNP